MLVTSAPRPPGCSVREASELFSDNLLQDLAIERQVGDDRLQLGVFVAQRAELAELLQSEPSELLFPAVERVFADAEAATDLGDFLAPST